jgi:hypothetical protein
MLNCLIVGDWLILEYLDGDKYHSHCGSEPRRGRVMFNCDRSVSVGVSMVFFLGGGGLYRLMSNPILLNVT